MSCSAINCLSSSQSSIGLTMKAPFFQSTSSTFIFGITYCIKQFISIVLDSQKKYITWTHVLYIKHISSYQLKSVDAHFFFYYKKKKLLMTIWDKFIYFFCSLVEKFIFIFIFPCLILLLKIYFISYYRYQHKTLSKFKLWPIYKR